MEPATLSILVWSSYILLVGLGLSFFPQHLLVLFGFEKPNEFWVRVLGVVTLSLAFFYFYAAFEEIEPFYWASVYARAIGLLGFTALVIFRKGPPRLLTFGILDGIGALWTLTTLLNDQTI